MNVEPRLLSVCCLGYKHAPFITDCMTSLWQDSYDDMEIIAMDDGSDDGSLELLRELQAQSPCPFKILEQENSGNVPANFNRLLRAARGDYILFTSLDDMQISGCIETRMQKLLADKNCMFAANTKIFLMENGGKLQLEDMAIAGKNPDVRGLLELEYSTFHSFYIQGAVFRREILEAVHGFSENMVGDDIVLRTKIFFYMLAHPELTFALIDEPGFIYRRHSDNISSNVMRQLKLAFQYCDKFWQGKPYPEMLKCWLLTGLDKVPYDEVLQAFTFSEHASRFLLDGDVQLALRANAVKSFIIDQQKKSIHVVAQT